VLIYEGRTSVLCVGQKVKTRPPYRVDISVYYPAQLTPQQEESVFRMCTTAVQAIGLTRGAAHVEFAFTEDGPLLFELGARCGGGHTPVIAHAASGVEEFVEVCRMACGDAPVQFQPFQQLGVDYRFLMFPSGRVHSVNIPDKVRTHPEIIDVEITLKSGDDILPIHNTSHRSGFVVSRGRDRREAIELANWASEQLSVSYSDGSTSHPLPLDLPQGVGDL